MGAMRVRRSLLGWAVLVVALVGCGTEPAASTRSPDPESASVLGLSEAEAATLLSLEQVDGHPLYTMHHYAPEPIVAHDSDRDLAAAAGSVPWACSLFAALAEPEARLFGRNFDWEFSPALLLFNHPPDGYASVSMVDIAYLGYRDEASANLTDRPLGELVPLLDSPQLPFDGLNEAGLAIGMAAVPSGYAQIDPARPTVDSVGIIRLVLDQAGTVAEAVELMRSTNVDFEGQESLHYLLADATGDAALVEYVAGEFRVLRSDVPWHQATNFVVSDVEAPGGRCARYDTITERLVAGGGVLDFGEALQLLQDVAQPHTQWSLVYGISTGEILVAMGRNSERVHTFSLDRSPAD
jgi:hypothetical protein